MTLFIVLISCVVLFSAFGAVSAIKAIRGKHLDDRTKAILFGFCIVFSFWAGLCLLGALVSLIGIMLR